MADDLLRKALAEQEAELQKLEAELAELRPLQQRRDNVFHLIAQMRFTLELPPYEFPPKEASPAVPTTTESAPKQGRAIWAVAREVLERSKVPMSPKEIADVLVGLGFTHLVGRPGKETVRTLLVKKKDVFTKLPDGRFELKT